MAKYSKLEIAEARERLLEWLKPGDTVYTVLEHVSRSGMQREIRVVVPYTTDDGRVDFLHPNHAAAVLLGERQGKRDGLIVGGCGMDMGFHVVYGLSEALYGYLRCTACGKYPSGAYRTCAEAEGLTAAPPCEYCGAVLQGGYPCLGKGKCPSNYHVNHRDTIQCPGTVVYNPDGPNSGEACRWVRDRGYVLFDSEQPCPVCEGKGCLPNPEGPERFDLLHTDGYALRHRWL